jgi:hypothetical protein
MFDIFGGGQNENAQRNDFRLNFNTLIVIKVGRRGQKPAWLISGP